MYQLVHLLVQLADGLDGISGGSEEAQGRGQPGCCLVVLVMLTTERKARKRHRCRLTEILIPTGQGDSAFEPEQDVSIKVTDCGQSLTTEEAVLSEACSVVPSLSMAEMGPLVQQARKLGMRVREAGTSSQNLRAAALPTAQPCAHTGLLCP